MITTKTAIGIGGSVDAGKCFSKGTRVMKYDLSSECIENIKPDDLVMGDDLKPRKVLSTHNGIGDMYEICIFDENKNLTTTYKTNGSHILCLKRISHDYIFFSQEYNRFIYKYIMYISGKVIEKVKYFSTKQFGGDFVKTAKRLDDFIKYTDYTNKKKIKFGDVIEISVSDYIKQYNYLLNGFQWYRHIFNKDFVKESNYISNTYKIQSIRKLEKQDQYFGFTIDDNGRFLLDDFSVVHNSSFVGVISTGVLDNGNGSARKTVAKHLHEIESGRTSDISTRSYKSSPTEAITLIDLCGHDSYFNTTAFGVSGHFLDYAFVMVSANRGVIVMTKQHLRLLISLNIPIVFVITHVDITPETVYNRTKEQIVKICTLYTGNKSSVSFVNDYSDFKKDIEEIEEKEEKVEIENKDNKDKKEKAVDTMLKSVTEISEGRQNIYSVITISNKTGFFIDTIKKFMSNLIPRKIWSIGSREEVLNNKVSKMFTNALEKHSPGMSSILPHFMNFRGTVVYIDTSFSPEGIGLVVTGIVRGEKINTGEVVYLGPFGKNFQQVRIRSFHNNIRQNVSSLEDHDRGCLNIIPSHGISISKDQVKKGMILISSLHLEKNICFRFKAVISMFNKAITLKSGNSPVISMATIKQSARMIIDKEDNNGNDIISFDGTSKIAIVTFKFKVHPEFVEPYNIFVLTSGDIQGIGLVLSILPISEDDDPNPDYLRSQKHVKNKSRSTKY